MWFKIILKVCLYFSEFFPSMSVTLPVDLAIKKSILIALQKASVKKEQLLCLLEEAWCL